MNDWAVLLQAIASLLWPLLTFGAVLVFRAQIKDFIGRLRRGKLLGQEVELDALHAEIAQAPLASSAVMASLSSLLTSEKLRAMLDQLVVSHPDKDHRHGVEQVIDALTSAAAESVKHAFVTIDSTPLLGRRGRRWEEPYDPSMSVRDFLDNIWFQMRPYLRPFSYPAGWVLRERQTGKLFSEMGRPWARIQGQSEDERSLREVPIRPGSVLDVVAGPDPAQAFQT